MTRKPDGAAALLAGLAEMLASGLLEDIKILADLPKPDTDIALERRVRLRGVIARTALSIHKLQAGEDHPAGPLDPDEADMDDQPDDADAIERKYVQLHARLAAFAARMDARRDQGADTARRPGSGAEQLAAGGQPRAA